MQQKQTSKFFLNLLIIINVAVFIWELTQLPTEGLLNGTANAQLIHDVGGYYTAENPFGLSSFTSMFTHVSTMHLVNNMISLYIFGEIMIRYMGNISFIITYILGGIMGNLWTFLAYVNETPVVTAGASGAVFAIMGATVITMAWNRNNFGSKTTLTLIILIGLQLFVQTFSTTINAHAHLGGTVLGVTVATVFFLIRTVANSNQQK